jgi:hypothetical protein
MLARQSSDFSWASGNEKTGVIYVSRWAIGMVVNDFYLENFT